MPLGTTEAGSVTFPLCLQTGGTSRWRLGRTTRCLSETTEKRFASARTEAGSATCRRRLLAAGSNHTVLVRDDGEALCFGQNGSGQCNVPPPAAGGWVEPHGACQRRRRSALLRPERKRAVQR